MDRAGPGPSRLLGRRGRTLVSKEGVLEMKRSTRRRPELESLEPLVLLSHAPTPTPARPVVSLVGTIHASGKLNSQVVSVSGSGDLGPVGKVSLKYFADVLVPSASVTLKGKHGKIILVGDSLLPPGSNSGTIHYRVIGGTNSYGGATGSGEATVTVDPLKGNKVKLDITFS
jgi:hypothetical protein